MIKLVVEDYCQNCPYFDPVTYKLNTDYIRSGRSVTTNVMCSDREKCNNIHNHLINELKELKGGTNNDSHSC